MRNTTLVAFSTGLALIAGCGGAQVSQELRTARQTMQQARGSDAARYELDQLRVAQRTLERAEAADDGSEVERDLAYLADRQTRLAMTNARRVATQRSLVEEERAYRAQLEEATIARNQAIEQQGDQLAMTRQALATVRGELAAQGSELTERTQELRDREQQLAQREQELIEAERRAAEAMGRLQELANVRQENDATIITLSGEVLFETNQADLRATARERLMAVAEALRSQPEVEIVVEGHTDSRGSDSSNQQLSQRRAEAVRQFLIEQGIEMRRLRAVGMGEEQPVADNASAEGRANNRRVEIELRPRPGDSRVTAR